jgi:hypothetical protein
MTVYGTFFRQEQPQPKKQESALSPESTSLTHGVVELLHQTDTELGKLAQTAKVVLRALDNKPDTTASYKENFGDIIKNLELSRSQTQALHEQAADISAHKEIPEETTKASI